MQPPRRRLEAKPPPRRTTSPRRRSPRRAPKRRATKRSTARITRSCARSKSSTAGSRARAISASWPSIPKPAASTPCRRPCAASRSRCRPTRPATCRSAHRQNGHSGADGLFAGDLAADQIPESAALGGDQAAARGCQHPQGRAEPEIRLAGVRAARHRDGAAGRHHADVLCARCRPFRSRPRSAGAALFRPQDHRLQRGRGLGKIQARVRQRHHRAGRRIRGRGRRRHAAAVAIAQAAADRRAHEHRLRDPGAAAGPGARPHGAARHLDRPAGALAPLGRVRAARHGARGGDPRARRRAGQSRQPQADRRHSVRQARPAGRHKDQDRAMVDRRPRAGGAGRARPCAAAEAARLAAGLQAALDLYGCAARLRQSADPPAAHLLRARRHHHRPALLLRAQPAEHPGAHRGGPQDQARLRGGARLQARLAPTIRRSSCGCSPPSPISSR